jgi:hypothetical protein
MAASEVAVKVLGYAARTSMELSAASLGEAGMAKGHLLCIFGFLERTGKAMSCAVASGEIAAEQKETAGAREASFQVIWDGTSNVKVTWAESASTGCNLIVQGWSGTDGTTPIDATGVWATYAATKTPTAASITTVTDDAVEGILAIAVSAAVLAKAPEGFTLSGSYNLRRIRETAGATGTTALEMTESASGFVLTYAIRSGPPRELSLLGIGR